MGPDLVQISEKFRYVKLKVSIAHSMAMATEKASMRPSYNTRRKLRLANINKGKS